jgi:hypothetical protein
MKRAGHLRELSILFCVCLGLGGAAACGPTASGPGGGGGSGEDCDDATSCSGDQICDPDTNECVADKPCSAHPECGNGGHCNLGTGVCEASQTGSPCVDDVQCQSGEACVGADNAAGGFCGCDGEEFAPEAVQPNMLIVLDRSNSMNDPAGNGQPDKWVIAEAAIEELVTTYEGAVRFGLSLYPSNNDCASGIIDVPIGDSNGADIMAEMTTANGNTPLRNTLRDTVIGYQGLQDPERPNYTLIVNDGEPNCAGFGNPDPTPQIAQLFNAQIPSFVVGFGGGVDAGVLNSMAEAGGTARPGATKYYQADNAAELEAAFDAIGGSILSCTFSLNAEPDAQVFVYGDGMPLEFMYDPDTMLVTILGTDCDSVRIGDVNELVVVNSCPIDVD